MEANSILKNGQSKQQLKQKVKNIPNKIGMKAAEKNA